VAKTGLGISFQKNGLKAAKRASPIVADEKKDIHILFTILLTLNLHLI
jgi:hypothetical protein